jgi:prepilin-type N-terminal cleavage/methylation domain-containing protein
MRLNNGFTLIEISIVLAIIGLLTVSIIGGMSYVNSAKISSAITLAQDISTAVNAFKQQYHMLPGDMSIDTTTPEFPNIQNAACTSGGDNNGLIGDKNGNTNLTESNCVAEILYQAGLAKVDRNNGVAAFNSSYGSVIVIATAHKGVTGTTFPVSILHVVEFQNVPCDAAFTIDSKIDDGIPSSGKVRSTCASNNSSEITVLDIAL